MFAVLTKGFAQTFSLPPGGRGTAGERWKENAIASFQNLK